MASILADENIHPKLISALQNQGHDVNTVSAVGLTGASDEEVLSRANREGRILVTADKDFGLILESGPLSGKGRVLLLRYQVLAWDRIAKDLSNVLAQVQEEYKSDPRLLVVMSEGHYRIRHAGRAKP